MKKVVIINQNAGYLTIDVTNAFASKYKETVIIAGVVKPMERTLDPSVQIQKIVKYNRTSSLKRIYTWIWSTVQIFFLLLFKYRHFEVVYYTNPPFAYLSSLILRQQFSVVIYDTYPNALKNIGISEKNIIYRWWSSQNTKLFLRANKIITLSEGMADQISRYVKRERITVIPNWAGSEKFIPIIKKDNPFIRKHKLLNKFIVLYSGNMGYTHSVETLVEVAMQMKENSKIHFMFIGEGQKKEKLEQLVNQYNLDNCTFMTWQAAEVLPFSLASANLAVISLNEETALLSVPSKTYNLMAVGSPLLCIAPEKSELSFLIDKYKNGQCFSKDKIEEISSFILELSNKEKLHKEFSKNSLCASKDFHYSNAKKYL